MNGELAQIIALVGHGNLFLQSGEAAKTDFSVNSTFQYVTSVKFARYKSNQDQAGITIAENVPEWFDFLRSLKVTHLWNIAFGWDRQDMPEHVAAAFAGLVPRAIQADLPAGFELWYPQWKTGGLKEKPCLIEYRSLIFPNSHVFPKIDLNSVKERLRVVVTQAKIFSERPDVYATDWTPHFIKSLDSLDSSKPIVPFFGDLLPEQGFSLEARQIIASAAQADVFGGMGSWNDMGFEQPEIQKEYLAVTTHLYEAIKIAIVTASNSFDL